MSSWPSRRVADYGWPLGLTTWADPLPLGCALGPESSHQFCSVWTANYPGKEVALKVWKAGGSCRPCSAICGLTAHGTNQLLLTEGQKFKLLVAKMAPPSKLVIANPKATKNWSVATLQPCSHKGHNSAKPLSALKAANSFRAWQPSS